MNKQTFNLSERRRTLLLAAAALGMGMLPFAARPDDDEKGASKSSRKSGSTSGSISVPETGPTGKVVVIGGGMAGATAAKYLRLWGGVNVSVTLVEPDTAYTSNIMSNLVLNGSRTVTTLQYSLAALTTKYGVVRKQAALLSIDPIRKTVTLSDQSTLSYDRLVLAPGVEFDNAYGLTQTDCAASPCHGVCGGRGVGRGRVCRGRLLPRHFGGGNVFRASGRIGVHRGAADGNNPFCWPVRTCHPLGHGHGRNRRW